MKVLYRYEIEYSNADDPDTRVDLKKYDVVKETDYSYFISYPYPYSQVFKGKLRRVSKNAYSTFAYDTKEKAMEHFKRRTFRRIQWFEYWKKECENALEIVSNQELIEGKK